MKRVLAVQNTWDDPMGHLGEFLEEHGIAYDTVNAEKQAIPGPEGYDALVILGGPQHANDDDRYPYLMREKELLREVVKQDMPYLGICLGGQLLASALGAAVMRHSMTEIGFYEVELTEEGRRDPLFKGFGGSQLIWHWHEDIFALPQGAVRLATSANTPDQAFRFGRCAYAVQYHIELTRPMLDTWLRYPAYKREIVRVIGEDELDRIEQTRPRYYPVYREHARMLFENFLKIAGCL
jgi:GMP synthase-like glutamine amidotransferase